MIHKTIWINMLNGKKKNFKSFYTVWFHFYNSLKMTEMKNILVFPRTWNGQWGVVERQDCHGCDYNGVSWGILRWWSSFASWLGWWKQNLHVIKLHRATHTQKCECELINWISSVDCTDVNFLDLTIVLYRWWDVTIEDN